MGGWRARRAAGAALVVCCCALAGSQYAAVASGPGGLLTERQVEKIEVPIQAAIKLEEDALSIRDHKRVDEVELALQHSGTELAVAQGMLSGHDLGGQDPDAGLSTAVKQDDEALARLRMHHTPFAAHFEIVTALAAKRAALASLLQVPTMSAAAPTLTGAATAGSEPGTADVSVTPPSTGVNAFRVLAVTPIMRKTDPPSWKCGNQTAAIVECKGPRTTKPLTLQLGYKGTTLPSLSLDGSRDGGKTFGRLARLTSPTTTAPPGTTMLTVTCGPPVPRGTSVQITGTDTPPTSQPITDIWTLPDGRTVMHTAIVLTPGAFKDALGTPVSGVYHVEVSTPGAQQVGCDEPVG